MKDGVIQQIGSPIKLYDEPVNKFVAGFIGSPQMNFIEVNVKDDVVEFNDGNKIHITKGIRDRLQKSGKMILGIRGEDIKFDSLNMELRKDDILKATVSNVEVMGNENNIYFTLGGETIIARAVSYTHLKFKEYSIELTNEEANQILEEVRKVSVGLKRELFDKELVQIYHDIKNDYKIF